MDYHKVKILANSSSPESPAQGFDVKLEINGQPFTANKLIIVAEAGSSVVKVNVEFAVNELEFEGEIIPTYTFNSCHKKLLADKEILDQIKKIYDLYSKKLGVSEQPD